MYYETLRGSIDLSGEFEAKDMVHLGTLFVAASTSRRLTLTRVKLGVKSQQREQLSAAALSTVD